MSGEDLNKNVISFIEATKESENLKFTFLIEKGRKRFFAYYEIEIRKITKENYYEMNKETLSYSSLHEGINKTKIIDYDADSKSVFRPLNKYKELVSENKENEINLSVAKALAKKLGKSFIFNDENINIFKDGFKNNTNIDR